MLVTRNLAEQASKELLIHALFLDDKLTLQVVKEAYRSRCRETHPDMGGTAEAFAAVDRAKHILLKWLERDPEPKVAGAGQVCDRCDGRGYIESRRAWRSMKMQCPKCRGTGDLDSEHEKGDFR